MKKLSVLIASLLCVSHAYGFEPFVVKDIRLDGLQRISVGTVFNYLPIKVGDNVSQNDTTLALKALYKTGFFKDVRFEREGDVLVVFVAERPAIAEINISGNDVIPKEQLEQALSDMGLSKGRVFDQSILETIDRELKRQYYSLGKYGVKVTTSTRPMERNRVEVNIEIAEGEEAEVYAVNIIGNETFDRETLLYQMELPDVGPFGGQENYSRQVLAGDLETLRSYYMDRGHINFTIDSTQVSLTPDKEDVYITINITEGGKYTISDVRILGEVILLQDEMQSLLRIKRGELFSRKAVTETRKNISDKLAEFGYPFANVNISPDVDDEARTVDLTIFVDPGRRVYVRRINVAGNKKTDDEVIRRELRQFEGDSLSTAKIATSRSRLNRTGFFEDVTVETPAVPGTFDQVDVNVNVKERATGSLSFGVGYSDTQGALLNFGLAQDNFMGGGKRVSISFDTGNVTQQANFSISDPYFTEDGVSQNFSLVAREIDAEAANIANYTTNTKAASLGYGIPLSELTRLNFGLAVEQTEIITGVTTSTQIQDFIANTNNGDSDYMMYKLQGFWRYDGRDKAIFATDGSLATIGYEVATPGGDLEFYKLTAQYQTFFPLAEDYTLVYNLDLGFADVYGDTRELPPFERYFVGGSRTVRGFESNSIGSQRDSNNDPLGGDRKLVTNLEFVLPNPFSEKSKELRLSTFIDGGFVWAPGDKLDLGDMRYSAGVALIWIAPVGIMRFSLAEPLNAKPGDETTSFQFTLGSMF